MAREKTPPGPPPSDLLTPEERLEIKKNIELRLHFNGWSVGFVVLCTAILLLVMKALFLVQSPADLNRFSQNFRDILTTVNPGCAQKNCG